MNKEEVRKVYNLARLDLNEEKLEKIAEKYNKIIEFINPIFDVNTDSVEETDIASSFNATFRKDEIKKSLDREDALKNAKETEYGQFKLKWEL
ncbi:MAG: Asp-tRNA(Asn)/Glu-tRNA(Gln) amidotransferase subunit GatC [Peptoniphilaceae bacterium]|nr:Asp-tRNA(Asn)/Glu-tRNA(Gln) amidotransferase subunit GatC [Peptoniphilaceae bacterium]MDD7383861.1 Asp-tRNA(Asn)/Glu-tRNA(Gln) amidotransferase subunit GatC [Peptoniphilaceae bacterium]MDY3738002.1 Asp-tRNA(Asn)/Glu-tRNA(Gln) amidotransferase subunit GatC [Peptoniphilaceae bacterium]